MKQRGSSVLGATLICLSRISAAGGRKQGSRRKKKQRRQRWGGVLQTVRRPRSENGRKARGSECEWPEMWERDEMRQGRKHRESWAEVEEMRGRKDVCQQRHTFKWSQPSLNNRSLLTVLSQGGLTCSRATEEWSRTFKSWWFHMNLGQRSFKLIFSGDISAPAWLWALWLRIIYSISCLYPLVFSAKVNVAVLFRWYNPQTEQNVGACCFPVTLSHINCCPDYRHTYLLWNPNMQSLARLWRGTQTQTGTHWREW